MKETEDNELILKYINFNDENSFNILYEKYRPFRIKTLNRYKKTILTNEEEIESEIDLAFYEAVIKFDTTKKTSFFTFLHHITFNKLNNLYNKNKDNPYFVSLNNEFDEDDENDIDLVADCTDYEGLIINNISQEELKDNIMFFFTVSNVKKFHIDIFIDFFFNNLTQREISKKYDISIGTISSIISRCKKKILKGELLNND